MLGKCFDSGQLLSKKKDCKFHGIIELNADLCSSCLVINVLEKRNLQICFFFMLGKCFDSGQLLSKKKDC